MPDFNQVFYNLFNEATDNMMAMADLLHKAMTVNNADERRPLFNNISRLNTTAQELRQQIYAVSSRSFVSPFERNDMCDLALAIYETSNMIDVAARRINLYIDGEVIPYAMELASVVTDCCRELKKCIHMLNDLKKADEISAGCNTIREYENHADELHALAINQLLAEPTDTLEIIKHTDILASLEKATDRCEHVTKVLETILIKNS